MKLNKIVSLIIVSAAMVSGVSCSDKAEVTPKKQQTVVTLSWWGNDTRNDYTINAMDIFEELHPDIKVKCSYSEWSGYEARSRVQMISDTEADVMQINVGWLSQYSPDGKGYYDLEKLTDIIDLSNFSEELLNYGRVNGVLNGIPIAMNAETVYINKTIYEKYGLNVPETWDDLFDAAEAMRNDGIYPMSAGSKAMWMTAAAYAEQVSGKSFLNSDGSLGFSAEEFRIMIEIYKRMVDEKVIPIVEFYDKLNITDGTYAGTIAWVSDAVNYCGKAIENGYEIIPAEYLSDGKTAVGTGWYAKPASLYSISKNTEHPEEAAALIDFMLNSREMALLQGVEKGIPLSTSAREVLDEEKMLTGIQYEASLIMENNPALRHMDPFMENSAVIDAYIEQSDLVIYGKASAEEASQELFRIVNNTLSQQRAKTSK